ncbi:MAG: CocE/NonD family hydrolase [Desulfatiglandaceae bacterium]
MSQPFSDTRPPLPPGIRLEANVYVPMRDDVRLAVDIYRPKAEGTYPAILSMSPYIKEIQHQPPQLCHSIEAGATPFFVPRGYCHIIASIRGSGFSQGRYNYYDMKEQQDGYDLIEWIAEQPWCSGNVGMIGDSYFGKIQYLVAALQPPHLKCIIPYDAGTDQYRDVVYKGGVFWAQFVSMWGVDTITQCLWPGPVEGKLPPANFIGDLASYTEDGPYYWERSAYTKLDKITVPTFSIVPLTAVHALGQIHAYPDIRAPKKLLVVPRPDWFANVLFLKSQPLNEQILRWLDHWLKGMDTGIMEEPDVTIFDSGTKDWHHVEEYPLPHTEWTRFYLRSDPSGTLNERPDGLLGPEAPAESEAPCKYTTLDWNRDCSDKSMIAYATLPLDRDLRVWGPLSTVLHAASSGQDTVWFIKLGDMDPDDRLTILTEGHLKASHRAVDESRSRPGQPFHTFQNPVLLEPDKIYEFQIELIPLFHTFKKGHRVWLKITSENPDYQGMLRSIYIYGGQPIPGENTVFHDPAHPSHLVLPVILDVPTKKSVGPPVSNIKWPLEIP